MYQQDFIKRLIQQFTQAVLQVVGLSRSGRLDEAAEVLEQTYGDLFGLHSTLVFYSPVPELIQLISRGDEDDPQRIFMLAELLRAEAKISQARRQDFDAHQRRLKSLALYLEAARRNPELEPQPILDALLDLQSAIREDGMPPDVQADLFFFFEDMGYYRQAMDAILTFVRKADHPDDVRPHLESFCQRMLDLSDEELAAAGLSRTEVQAASRRSSRP